MELIIKRIYNNNSALVSVDGGKEAVIQGKGIGFNKKRGESISATKVDKILYLGSLKDPDQIGNLLKNVPLDIVVSTWNAIDNVKKIYHLDLLNYLYITLSDHIYQAYKKLQAGAYQATPLPPMTEKYPVEYHAAEYTLGLINRNLNIHFPSDEVKSIALHYINAIGEEKEDLKGGLSNKINAIVVDTLKENGISRSLSNENYYDRLMIHLKYLVERLENHTQDQTTFEPKMGQYLDTEFPQSNKITQNIINELTEKLNITLTEDERIYFLIHIQRLVKENK